jgi:nicotinamidase-related amidase
MGGDASTSAVVAFALERYASALGAAQQAARPRSADALIVVDLQNDYCAEDGVFHRLGLVDPKATRRVADATERLVRLARQAGVEVTFVRTVMGDAVPETVRRRNRAEGRAECVRPGSWGSEPFGPASRVGERVVVKGGYDAFIGTPLERDLRLRGVERLFLSGVFTDVCVDALARSAYQLGFEVVVVGDTTLPLERDQAECLAFMERFYGARVVDSEAAAALLAGAARARGEQRSASLPRRAEAPATLR